MHTLATTAATTKKTWKEELNSYKFSERLRARTSSILSASTQ